MRKFRIQFLIFLNIIFILNSCSQYRRLQEIKYDDTCINKFKPYFSQVIYKTSVDVIGKHLSGLLVFKYMPDSSTRVVFSNEMGLTFFDFGFPPGNGFTVYQVVAQLNKKALIKTLRKDFELVMFRNLDTLKYYTLTDSLLIYHAFPQSKGVNYYITDVNCQHLMKMQRASNKKPVMEAFFGRSSPGISPDSILIRHLNFDFTISLQKITPLAAQ